MQKNIFHIHNNCCHHSSNTLDNIVHYSLSHGYKKLYFTEHCYCNVDCVLQKRRPTTNEIKNLKSLINIYNKKYAKKLHIYFGYEIEFNKQNQWYYEQLVRDPYADFLIFGNHFYGDIFKMEYPFPLVMNCTKNINNLLEYKMNQIAAMESGLFSWIAHPDIFLNSYKKWDKKAQELSTCIIQCAKRNKSILGFNVNFPSPFNSKKKWHYPVKQFWNLVSKTNVKVLIESDSHDIHTIKQNWLNNAYKLALSYGLKNNLIQNIELKYLSKKPKLFLCEDKMQTPKIKSIIKDMIANNILVKYVNRNDDITKIFQKTKIKFVDACYLFDSRPLIKQIANTNACPIDSSMTTYDKIMHSFIKFANIK